MLREFILSNTLSSQHVSMRAIHSTQQYMALLLYLYSQDNILTFSDLSLHHLQALYFLLQIRKTNLHSLPNPYSVHALVLNSSCNKDQTLIWFFGNLLYLHFHNHILLFLPKVQIQAICSQVNSSAGLNWNFWRSRHLQKTCFQEMSLISTNVHTLELQHIVWLFPTFPSNLDFIACISIYGRPFNSILLFMVKLPMLFSYVSSYGINWTILNVA